MNRIRAYRRIRQILEANPNLLTQRDGVRKVFDSILSYDPPAAARYLEVITKFPAQLPKKANHHRTD